MKYTTEWFEPSHGPKGTWYRSDVFDNKHMANARKRDLERAMREHGLSNDKIQVRVRAIDGRAPALIRL